ncbi:MAG: hypothetical protein AAF358_24355 [Pseudomonadota bacterium]
MFTRPIFATAVLSVQQALLNRVAALLDAGSYGRLSSVRTAR